MKYKLLLLSLFTLFSCSKEINHFVPDGDHRDGIHEIKVVRGFVGDLQKINNTINGIKVSYLVELIKKSGVDRFLDSSTCNTEGQKIDPFFNINGFDFDNYFLVPISVISNRDPRHSCCHEYQVKCFLDQNKKTITLKINSKYRWASLNTNQKTIQLRSWISIPKVVKDWELIIENNL